MIEQLKKLYANYKVKGKEPYEQILGDSKTVMDFNNFWELHQSDLMLVAAYNLNEFVNNLNFTPEELIAYKKGIADSYLFFNGVHEELKKKTEKQGIDF